MIRAQPEPTHWKSLRMFSSSSTFGLGSAHLLINCVLTKFKQEASWTGNLCKHQAETKHSERGGDTFWKGERDALTPTCLPQSTIKGSFFNIPVRFMALLVSHRRTFHLSLRSRLQHSWYVGNNHAARLWRYQSSQTHSLSLAFFSPRDSHQHCTLLLFHLLLWLIPNYLLQLSLQCLCFWIRLV